MIDLTKLVDVSLLSYFKSKIDVLLSGKVDKVNGKGLSTNDFSNSYKDKLDGVESGAQVNVIERIKRNGANVSIVNKTADISVPTSTSELTNNSHFVSDSSYVHTDNNFTSADKSKLNGIASGAQVNVLESVKVNNVAQTVSNKAVNITVPTASTSTPKMDGNASAGSSSAYAKGDHIHPKDTSKQDTLVSGMNIKTIDGNSILGSGNLVLIPAGGTSGQVLAKRSNSNYDLTWVTVQGGGTTLPDANGVSF